MLMQRKINLNIYGIAQKMQSKTWEKFLLHIYARNEQRALQKMQENEKFIVKMPLYDFRIHY